MLRLKYYGLPSKCCLQDSSVTDCDPVFKNPNNIECAKPLSYFCRSNTLTDPNWDIWTENEQCNVLIGKISNINVVASIVIDAIHSWIRYISSQTDLGIKTDIELAHTVMRVFLDNCSRTKGACDGMLNVLCENITKDYLYTLLKTFDSSDRSHNIITACACHMNKDQYMKYSGLIDKKYFQSCDPLCNISGVIKYHSNGIPIDCKQVNCIIDDVIINIINSKVGNITFKEVCNGCFGKGCVCIFNTDGTEDIQSISKNCSKCSVTDKNTGLTTPLNCSTGNPTSNDGKQFYEKYKYEIIPFFSFLFIILILIVIFK